MKTGRLANTFLIALFEIIALLSTASLLFAADNDAASSTAVRTNTRDKYISSEDGWFDISGFIDQAYGFAPIIMPITEPAVGYGAAGALAFIDKPKDEATEAGFGRPNVTVAGGLGTENGTWGVFGGDERQWLGDSLQTQVGLVYASVNLDFYGIGKDNFLQDHPLKYNLEPAGGMVNLKYRLGRTRLWAGLSYTFMETLVTFDNPTDISKLPDFEHHSRIGGLTPSFTFDSRDNMFTPAKGTYIEGTAGLFSQALGGDSEFQLVTVDAIQYLPVGKDFTFGMIGGATLSFDDVPFYMKPYIELRGAQAMRYQGDEAAQMEAELRWQFWRRFSLVGFGGIGTAWNDFGKFNQDSTIVTGGAGFRYELARKYGLHMGIDLAFGPDEPIIYVQFGSAWIRP